MTEKLFIPTEQWNVTDPIEPRIDAAIKEMNKHDSKDLILGLRKDVQKSDNGIAYAILKGTEPEEYSNTDALVMFNPFANGATDNMLVRAEFIREVARVSGIRDKDGKLVPVIMLASPAILHGSSLELSDYEREKVRLGEFGPVAKELLSVVSAANFGNIALLGFSQGADVALAGARVAFSSNLDTSYIAIGDPAGVEDRSGLKLGTDFTKAGNKALKQSVEASHLKAQKEAQDSPIGLALFGASALLKTNRNLWSGMSHDTFGNQVDEILSKVDVEKFIVGYGSDSAITKPREIEPTLQEISDINDDKSVISVRVNGGNHTWGDQLSLLGRLFVQKVE